MGGLGKYEKKYGEATIKRLYKFTKYTNPNTGEEHTLSELQRLTTTKIPRRVLKKILVIIREG